MEFEDRIRYLVTGRFITIHGGVLQLNDDQARRRQAFLKAMGGGLFEVTGPCGFKHGEVFGYSGPELSKKNAREIEQIDLDSPDPEVKDPEGKDPEVRKPEALDLDNLDPDALDMNGLMAVAKQLGIEPAGDMTEDDLRLTLAAVTVEDADPEDDNIDLDAADLDELRKLCGEMGVEFTEDQTEDDLRMALIERQDELDAQGND